jgi:hypothetical protein
LYPFSRFSGAAWAWSVEPDNINPVRNWPSGDSQLARISENGKAPTRISYSNPNKPTWGYGISSEDDPHKWFKLLLQEDRDFQEDVRESPYIRKARNKLQQSRMTAKQVVADYLKLLWCHILESMRRERGASVVNGLPFKVVVTVPAIWKDYAKERMEWAIKAAGILDDRLCGKTTLQLVAEPEAAALAVLTSFRKRQEYKVCMSTSIA